MDPTQLIVCANFCFQSRMCKTNTYLLIGAGQTLSSGPLVTVEQLERRSSSETIEPLRSYPGPRHPSRTLAPPVSRLRPPVICPASVLVLTCALVSHLYSNSIKHSTLIYTYCTYCNVNVSTIQ